MLFLLQFDRVGCYSDALELRLGGAVFESRPEHWLYLLFSCFYLISLVTCRDIIAVTISQSFFFHILYNYSYINRIGVRRFVFSTAESTIK